MTQIFHTSLFLNVLFAAAGGGIGAAARLLVYHAVHGHGRQHGPWTTMGVNLVGCLLLGVVLGWAAGKGGMDDRWRTFLTVGVLGGFTTFSTYAGDVMRLLNEKKPGEAAAYLVLSALLGVALCAAGMWAGGKSA